MEFQRRLKQGETLADIQAGFSFLKFYLHVLNFKMLIPYLIGDILENDFSDTFF